MYKTHIVRVYKICMSKKVPVTCERSAIYKTSCIKYLENITKL